MKGAEDRSFSPEVAEINLTVEVCRKLVEQCINRMGLDITVEIEEDGDSINVLIELNDRQTAFFSILAKRTKSQFINQFEKNVRTLSRIEVGRTSEPRPTRTDD